MTGDDAVNIFLNKIITEKKLPFKMDEDDFLYLLAMKELKKFNSDETRPIEELFKECGLSMDEN